MLKFKEGIFFGEIKTSIRCSFHAKLVLDFYIRNKDFFEPWEAVKVPNFYTLDYQRAVLVDEMNQFIRSKYLRNSPSKKSICS